MGACAGQKENRKYTKKELERSSKEVSDGKKGDNRSNEKTSASDKHSGVRLESVERKSPANIREPNTSGNISDFNAVTYSRNQSKQRSINVHERPDRKEVRVNAFDQSDHKVPQELIPSE